jgi:predicted nucleic acid-binding protein
VTLVVDASVASKWVLPEPSSAQAAALRSDDRDLIAPSLVVAEIGNALWKSARRGDLADESAEHLLRIAIGHYARLVSMEGLALDALRLATDLDHPIYDCFYLALAERERAPLISADARLVRAATRLPGVEARLL